MTPLEFVISARNADANASIDQFAQKVEGLKAETNELYEGPAREMRMRTELRGLVQDIAMGQSPVQMMVNALGRLAEMGRFAMGVAGVATIGIAIDAAIIKAEKSFDSFDDKVRQILGVDMKNASDEALKGLIKDAQELEDKYAQRGLMDRLLHGRDMTTGLRSVADVASMASEQLDENQATAIQAHTDALRTMTDEELARQGEIEAAKADLEEKARAAREKGEEATAEAYEDQMGAAIDRINAKYQKALAERGKQTDDLHKQLAKAQQEEGDVNATPADKLAELNAQKDEVQKRIDARIGHLFNQDIADDQTRDKTALANLNKEILEQQRDIDNADKEEKQKALDDMKRQEENVARLRAEGEKAEFDNLSKEEKLVVLRAEQAKLEAALRGQSFNADDPRYLTMRKLLFEVQKEMGGITPTREKLPLDDFEQAGGRYAGVNYGALPNDRANRAEGQRDKMIDLLKAIANRDAASLPSAF